MIGVVFWNTSINAKADCDLQKISRIEDAIVDIVAENNCDIIILAEFDYQTSSLCNKLSLIRKDFSERKPFTEKARVKVLADNRLTSEIIRDDSKYYVIHDFSLMGYHFLLGGVHLPSKLYAGGEIVARQFIDAIKEAEKVVNHDKVVMVGDFNANPFEDIMVNFEYMHAIFDSSVVERIQARQVLEVRNQIFYNPMWNLLGDFNHPKGSYYYDSSAPYKLYWNIFDQVIMSTDFMKAYMKESLKIIAGTNNFRFLGRTDKPDKENYSDHLPVFFSLKEELL